MVGSLKLDPVKMGFVQDYSGFKEGAQMYKRFQEDRERDQFGSEDDNASFQKNLCEHYPARCFDAADVGNSNKGHEPSIYKGELTHNQKMDLIEFLKVLRPELEYSWTSRPIYKVKNEVCTLRQ
jgi:hypothetical protein